MTQTQFETLKGLLRTPGGLSEFFQYFSGIAELFCYGFGLPEEAGITTQYPEGFSESQMRRGWSRLSCTTTPNLGTPVFTTYSLPIPDFSYSCDLVHQLEFDNLAPHTPDAS